jgi:hypothetical protein
MDVPAHVAQCLGEMLGLSLASAQAPNPSLERLFKRTAIA